MKRCPQCSQQYDDYIRFCTRDGQNLVTIPTPSESGAAQTSKMQQERSDPMIGRVLAGRYRLMAKLGQGGMGAVYKGQHMRMNRLTAIKILSSHLANNSEFVTRFEREAEMASRIDHPNAVSIYDFGEAEDGIVYLAMEFVDGVSLSDIIQKGGPLSLERVVNITLQAAEALSAAHQLGIIHRDFKPDNVIVCQKTGRPDWVKVVDFGIAKWAAVDPQHQALTQTGFVLGTPQYMSPEQVVGDALDQRSDLYALALVSYEMLTGTLPFAGSSPQSQMVKRLLEPPMPIRIVRPQLMLPPAVESVIMRALARYPKDRHSSTVEFARDLEHAVRSHYFNQPRPIQPQPFHAPPGGARPISGPTPYPAPQPPPAYTNTPQNVTPVSNPSTQATFQPSGHTVRGPYGPQPPQSSHVPIPPLPGQPKPFVIVLIVVMGLLLMMGACFTFIATMD